MLKLGVIGTSWISAQFVDAALATAKYQLAAVYSRKLAHAKQFAARFNQQSPHLTTDLADLFAKIDVVYIASPNSLHASQAQMALASGVDVIVEKPLCVTSEQLHQLQATLKQHPDRFLWEAARHTYLPTYRQVKAELKKTAHIYGATLSYQRYSSKFDAYLAGKVANVFLPEFAGGALMDLGVYAVHDALGWFGMPKKAQYLPQYLATGVDGAGVAVLEYDDFNVTLMCGKNQKSGVASEIYLGAKTLQLAPNAADLLTVGYLGEKPLASVAATQNPLYHEAQAFANQMLAAERNAALNESRRALAQSVQVVKVLEQLRKSCQLKLAGDKF